MAITKILPVRGQLKGCLDYAANPQKTEYFSTADMQRLIGYTQNKDKTEHQLYVSGFNCMPQNAYCIMQATKQRWGKPLNGGNVGYHIIQSFKPGEATPDQVHEIGCEFARRFLADWFECTVSTHLDKGHLHNHIVVNSVSFMDGRMFRNDFTTYYKGIRAISDELCRENRLSVVETDGHGKSYGEWKHEKEGTPTLRGMVKADVEMAMASADSFAGFIAELQQMGYKVKYGPKVTHTLHRNTVILQRSFRAALDFLGIQKHLQIFCVGNFRFLRFVFCQIFQQHFLQLFHLGNAQIFRHFVENDDEFFFHNGTLLFCVPSSCSGISPYLLILAEILLHQAVKQKLRFVQGLLYGNF